MEAAGRVSRRDTARRTLGTLSRGPAECERWWRHGGAGGSAECCRGGGACHGTPGLDAHARRINERSGPDLEQAELTRFGGRLMSWEAPVLVVLPGALGESKH